MKTAWMSLLLAAIATDAFAAEPVAPPAPTSFVFEETVALGPLQAVGETPLGRRQLIPITGGTIAGPQLHGRVLSGGGDYQVVRSDGSLAVNADYMIETDDQVVIHVRNVGVIVPPAEGRAPYLWAAPSFDAPNGRYGWLNDAIFVSRISPAGDKDHPAVRITIYKVG